MNDFLMQPSQSTTIFGFVELSEAVQILARAGYRCVELSHKTAKRAEQKSVADDLGVRVWSLHGTLDLLAGMGTATERQTAVENEIRAMEDVAVYAPCPYVIHYYCRNTEPDGVDNWRCVVEPLHERAKSLGFVLCLEMIRVRPSKFPYLCKSREVAEFVRSFGSRHLGLCIDVNHVNVYEPIPNVVANSAGLIRTVHLSDNHGGAEGPLSRPRHLPPGDGVINWHEALSALYGAGYEGPLNMELHVEPSDDILVRTRRWAETIRDDILELPGSSRMKGGPPLSSM